MTVAFKDIWSYECGDKEFHNKFHAITENLNTGKPIKFNAPQEFMTYDFSQEPEEDLATLLKNNAERIRQSYNHVRLYYSGGSDSDLVLRTFLENNIHIDEIICWKCGIPPADFEIDQYALPRLSSMDLKGAVVTVSQPTMDEYIKYYKDGPTQERYDSGVYNFHTHIRIIEQLEQFREDIKAKGVANIRGIDRPHANTVEMHDGKWYTNLLDVDLEPNAHTINFFSDDPKIHCKQAHLFKNGKQINREVNDFVFPKKNLVFGEKYFVKYKGIKLHFANHKEKIALKYLLENQTNVIDLWIEYLRALHDLTKGKWWNQNYPELGTVGILSNFFCLDQKVTKTVDELYPNGFKT